MVDEVVVFLVKNEGEMEMGGLFFIVVLYLNGIFVIGVRSVIVWVVYVCGLFGFY